MTATQTQIRRDTAANLALATPASGEPGYDTTNKRLVVGDGSTAGGIPCVMAADQQRQKFIYPTVGGTANAITLTNSVPISGYGNSLTQTFKATGSNTGAVTVNVDSKGSRNVKKLVAGVKTDLATGDIYAGGIYQLFDDGTDFLIKLDPPANSAGLVLLSVQNASNSSSLDFTSVINSSYSSYIFEIDNLRPATAQVSLLMLTSTNNGAGYDNGVNAYQTALWHLRGATIGSSALATLTASQQIYVSAPISSYEVDNGAGSGVSGQVTLFNPLNATQYKRVAIETGHFSGTDSVLTHGMAARLSTADVDAVRFLFSSGNITSGTIRCYGRKSS